MNPVLKYLLVVGAVLATLLASASIGWQVRGLKCANDLAEFQQSLNNAAKFQRDESRATEVKQESITAQSSQRLDTQQATQQKEIVYVDKQVIQYRDRWRDRACERPDDWVQLYNASLFGPDPAMPEAGTAGSTPDVSTVLLPAGRD